jgi:hypothetical protein
MNWAITLGAAHATAALLVAVGHDHHSGEVHLCVPEEITAEWAARVLARCIEMLGAGEYHRD